MELSPIIIQGPVKEILHASHPIPCPSHPFTNHATPDHTFILTQTSPPIQIPVVILPSPSSAVTNNSNSGSTGTIPNGCCLPRSNASTNYCCHHPPCYFFGLAHDTGARVYAFFNLFYAIFDILLSFYNLLYINHLVTVRITVYRMYFDIFYAIECHPAMHVDVSLNFLTSILNTVTAWVFYVATHSKRGVKFRAKLCARFNLFLFAPLVVGIFQRVAIVWHSIRQDHSPEGDCQNVVEDTLDGHFWFWNVLQLIVLLIWNWYGVCVSKSFVGWLKMGPEERAEELRKLERELLGEEGSWVSVAQPEAGAQHVP